MDREKKVRNVLLVLAVLLGLFLIVKMTPRIVFGKHVLITLTKNKDSIVSITNARNPDFSLKFAVSRVDFPEGEELKHPDRGPLGFQSDFYLDADAEMQVKKEGTYIFSVASDDGFQLWIGGNQTGEFIGNRPFTTNSFSVNLSEGTSSYRLSYYQGYGRLGLQAYYQFLGDGRIYMIGQDSRYIRFRKAAQ